MNDNELDSVFNMTEDGEEGTGNSEPSRKRGFFERLRDKKARRKQDKKGVLDDILDFEDGDEVQEGEAPASDVVSSDEPQVPADAENPEERSADNEVPPEEDREEEPAESEEGEDAEETEDAADQESQEEPSEQEEPESGEDVEEEVEEDRPSKVSHKPKYRLKTPDIDIPKPSLKTILAIVLAALLIAVILCVALLPAFRVKYMKIDGNVVVSDQEILEATKLKYNAHLLAGISGNILDILKLNYGKTEEKIKRENPYIRDIEISVSLPSTVQIKVDERSKISYVKTVDGYA